jgi:iron complex outermembrane receptor protein
MRTSRGKSSSGTGVLSPGRIRRTDLRIAAGLGASLMSLVAMGQVAPETAVTQLQEIVVTGSHIRRTDAETPSPVQVITAEELHESGYTSTQDVLHNLTANGQGTLSQSFSGAFASGAAGIALRGLNVGSTLTLIDGHRMAPYPIGDDGQRSFVDVSNIPFDAIERIEVLKDGASAVYGSDAIAGVVNIILKKSYQGAAVSADAGTSVHADGNTYHMSAIYGLGDLPTEGHNFYVTAEYRKQQEIKFTDRGGIFTQTDFTGSGGYNVTQGVPNPIYGTTFPRTGTGYVTNGSSILGFMPGCDATKLAAGQCTYHDTWSQIQPPTENLNFVGKFTQNLTDGWQASFQASYFEGKSEQVNGPNRAFAGGYAGTAVGPGIPPTLVPVVPVTTIPSTNPSFPAGTGATVANLRYTFLNIGPQVTQTDSKAYRAIAELTGKLAGWEVDVNAGFTEVALSIDGRNYVNPGNLQTALDSTTDPFLVGQQNSAAVNNFVAPLLHTYDTSKLSFGHLGASRSVFDLPGGPLGVAVGADYFQRNQFGVAPGPVQAGLVPNYSNNFTVGLQQVASGYFEVDAPIVKQFDVDAAVRYDHYNLSGGRASPKVGFKFTPIPEFAIRGTASGGFRAPGPSENGQSGQTFFAGSSPDPVLCPHPANPSAAGNFQGQCVVNVPGLQTTNPNLKPETSKSFTLGLIFEPIKDISATIDIYSIEIDHQIVGGGGGMTVRGNNLSPLPLYQANGSTVLTAPPVAPIVYQTLSYINANTTKTDGADFGFEYHHAFDGIGEVRSKATWSYTRKYDLTIAGTTYHLAGTHGPTFYTGDTGNPKSRVQWQNSFARANWQVSATVNYISSFSVLDPSSQAFGQGPMSTCLDSLSNQGGAAGIDYAGVLANGQIPAATSCNVNHFTTVDLYGRVDVTDHLQVHASVVNATNTKAPLDWGTYGGALGEVPWNPSLHTQGAIGAFFTLGATYKFY